MRFDELLEKAIEKVEEETAIYHKDDLADEKEAVECPECSNETLVIGTSKGNYCFFCDEVFSLHGCDRCGGPIYGEPNPDKGLDICTNCMDYFLSKD